MEQSNPVSDHEEYVGLARAGIQNSASTQIQGADSAPGLLNSVVRSTTTAGIEADAALRTAAWARSQESRLQQGLATQSAPDFGGHNYSGYTSAQLHQMVTTNIDPGAVGAAGAAWNTLGNTYARIAQDLGSVAGASESGWVGAAGDSARTFLAGMASWADTTAQGAQLAGNQLGMQSEAAQTAMHSMPTPVEPPTAADVRQLMLRSTFNPAAGAAQLDQQFQAAQQAHAEAVRVVRAYDANLAAVGNTMPAFHAPPALGPSTGGASNGAGGGSGIPGTGQLGGAQGPRGGAGQVGLPGGAGQVGPASVLAGQASRSDRPAQPGSPGPAGLSGSVTGQSPTVTPQSASMPPNSSAAASTTPPPGGMSLPGAQAGGPNVVGSPNVPSEPLLGDRVIGAPATRAPEGAGVLGRVDEVAARATAGP
ncbi:MAG TPA: PPE domain-containing protein, partial [Pseudonocardiaceae bacterium]